LAVTIFSVTSVRLMAQNPRVADEARGRARAVPGTGVV
jgi:hypothetical protein